MKKLLFALAVLALPCALFAEQGAIVGYIQSWRGFPSDAQLSKLTHVILFQIYPNADGSALDTQYWSYSDANVATFVNKAHAQGKKVLVGIGGSGGSTANFPGATDTPQKRSNFANAVKNFVSKHNLDGADLDWEPLGANPQTWQNWLDFALALKTAMPDKRISGTLGADTPNSQYGNHLTKDPTVVAYFKTNIWKLDAVQLMTYDMDPWPTKADANSSQTCINNWAAFGQGQQGYSKEKIFIGIHMSQDSDASARQKAGYARQNGFGGAILWEINDGILNPAYDATQTAGGHTGGGGNPPVTTNYTITVTHNGNGTVKDGNTTINNNGSITVASGGSKTLTITANSGYVISDVKIGGVTNSNAVNSGSYTFNNVTSNQTIAVTFTQQVVNRTITVTHNGNGTVKNGTATINNNGAVTVANGGSVTLTITPNSGYVISDVKINGTSNSQAISSGSYTFSNVTSNQTIAVTFTQSSGANRTITVTYTGSGTVKNGTATINNNGAVTVANGGSVTLTIAANSGYVISDVKINGTTNNNAVNSGSYTFSNVTSNQTIAVTFTSQGTNPPNPPAGDAPDLADGSWEWDKIMDDENLGSSVTYNVAPANVSFTLKAGVSIEEQDKWTYAEIACFPGGIWTGVTGVTITYTSDQPILLTLQDNIGLGEEGRGYNYRLNSGNNVTVTIPITQFKHYESDWETETNLSTSQLGIFEGVSISPADENVTVTGSIKVLKVNGLIVEEEDDDDDDGGTPITKDERKTVSTKAATFAGASVMNGNINLSLPQGANNANIVLFDVRGRILFERSVAVSGNAASVALPKDISRSQIVILQVRTNTGYNLTKRMLIK